MASAREFLSRYQHEPIHDNTEDIHAMLAEYDPDHVAEPPSYSFDNAPPSYSTSLCRTYTCPRLISSNVRFQNEATFFTHVTTIYPPRTQLWIPTRINVEDPSLRTSVEPVRLGYKCAFAELQQILMDELAKRDISTHLSSGYKIVGKITTTRRSQPGAFQKLLRSKKAAELERRTPMQIAVHEENWERVLASLSNQETKGLVLIVWPERILPEITSLAV
ncbi:hypothetical protein LTR95_007531 [Oleoguttula sp. CCFEE 5521]